jgi:hypothetical protein
MVMNNNLLSLCIMIPKCILHKGDKKLILTKQYKQRLSPTDLQIMFSWDVTQSSGKQAPRERNLAAHQP